FGTRQPVPTGRDRTARRGHRLVLRHRTTRDRYSPEPGPHPVWPHPGSGATARRTRSAIHPRVTDLGDNTMPTTNTVVVCLPITDRQASVAFYRDGLRFAPAGAT